GDELCVLGAEVDDEDGALVGVVHGGESTWRARAEASASALRGHDPRHAPRGSGPVPRAQARSPSCRVGRSSRSDSTFWWVQRSPKKESTGMTPKNISSSMRGRAQRIFIHRSKPSTT